jgi:acetyl esterase/lipase
VIFASAGYRLAPAHVFPAGYEDACSAFAWLHRNIAGHGGDPQRMFVGGHSSGAHYAALLAVRCDWRDRHGVPQDAVRGCLPVSGVYDLTAAGGLSQRPRFLGAPDSGAEREASPILNIQGVPPPFLMAHGSDDFPHLMEQAARMEAALKAAGGLAERLVLQGRTHFKASLATAEHDAGWLARALAFINSGSRQ